MSPSRIQSPRQPSGSLRARSRRPAGRSRRAGLLALTLAMTTGLLADPLAAPPAQAASDVRFQINLSAPLDWWSDFDHRTNLILTHSSPTQADWYTSSYVPGHSWGPKNPQLYSVDSSAIGAPSLVSKLTSDRGHAVYSSTINQPPSGVTYADWATARLMAAAQRLIGTTYQHLHLPQFNPDLVTPRSNFDLKKSTQNLTLQSTQQLLANPQISGSQSNPYYPAYGAASPGIDCTDFSAYIYNLALGYQMPSSTSNQITFPSSSSGLGGAADAIVLDSTGTRLTPQFFYSPNYGTGTINTGHDLDALIQSFQAGDLLYIRGQAGDIVHVVIWLGAYGTNSDGSPSTVPLVISSHDNTPAIFTSQDINLDPTSANYGFPNLGPGETITTYLPPPGVQILPFTNQNWFYTNFAVAMRVLPSQGQPAVPAPAAPLWLLALIGQRCRRLRRRLSSRPGFSPSQPIQTAAAPG